MLDQLVIHKCLFSETPNWHPFLFSTQIVTAHLGRYLKCLSAGYSMLQSSLSHPKGRPGGGSFLLICLDEGLWKINTMDFLTDFYVVLNLPVVQEPLNFFSGLFTKGIDPCITIESVSPCGKVDLGFLFCHLADITQHKFLKSFLNQTLYKQTALYHLTFNY